MITLNNIPYKVLKYGPIPVAKMLIRSMYMNQRLTFETGPKELHTELTYLSKFVLTGGSPGRIMRAAKLLDNAESHYAEERGIAWMHGYFNGIEMSGVASQMGPGAVSITVPEMINAYRVSHPNDKNLAIARAGTSGALHPKLKEGDFVVTTKGVKREKTSSIIMSPFYRPHSSPEMVDALYEAAMEHKLETQSVYKGPTQTTDEIYLNSIDQKVVWNWMRRFFDYNGLLAVSMENTALAAEAAAHDILFDMNILHGEVLVISDNPLAESLNQAWYHENMAKVEERHLLTVFSALEKIARSGF